MTELIARAPIGAISLVRNESAVTAASAEAVRWDRESILFSACNEDSASEIRALGPLEGKRLLCVTAGGGRVLSLLGERPREVWAVDLNPAQNALLELKIAGMRELDHAAYLGFLGVRQAPDRAATYDRLRPRLSAGAQRFFDAHPAVVLRGALLEGKLERFFKRLAVVLRVVQPFGLTRLFSFDDLAEQRAFLAGFDTPLWRVVAQNAARRWVLRTFSGDPGFYRYVPEHIPLHRTIYDRIHGYFWTHLARDNALLQLVFFGRYVYEPALPIYLNARTYDRVKAALEHVHVETLNATVGDALEYAGAAAFDAFSLSDISSYLDDEGHHRLFEGALAAARPGARLCSRSNLHHRPLAPEQAARIRRDHTLERSLREDDDACVHDFLIGEIG